MLIPKTLLAVALRVCGCATSATGKVYIASEYADTVSVFDAVVSIVRIGKGPNCLSVSP